MNQLLQPFPFSFRLSATLVVVLFVCLVPIVAFAQESIEADTDDTTDLVGLEEEWPEWMWEEERPRPWYVTFAPGYSFFATDGGGGQRHGTAMRVGLGYTFKERWRLGARGMFSVQSGDLSPQTKGLYGLAAVGAEVRYLFDTGREDVFPYLLGSTGWRFTRRDIETDKVFSSHSIGFEGGAGVMFTLRYDWRLGAEFCAETAVLGRKEAAGSVAFRSLFNFEYTF